MTIPAITLRPEIAESAQRSATETRKLADATRQFEAMLIRQILQQARHTTIPSPGATSSAVSDIYQDMVNAQMADAMSRSGGLGLAGTLQQQWTRSAPGSLPSTPGAAALKAASHD